HIHEFLPARGGTEIVDHLEICLPFHYGGEIAVRWLIARTVNASFALRHRALDVLASNGVLASCAKENLDYDRRELSSVFCSVSWAGLTFCSTTLFPTGFDPTT